MRNDESVNEKIARIDENVKRLMLTLPLVERLHVDSAVNKKEHKIALGLGGLFTAPFLLWLSKKLGIS